MIRTRVGIFDTGLIFGSSGALGPSARAEALADFARDQIAAVDRQNAAAAGRPIPHETAVDGSRTDDLSRVRPDGVIVATWELGVDAVQWIWDLLHESGPVLTGAYRKSATIFADGAEVETPQETLGAREVVILSLVHYARKIERGEKGYAPGAVYEGVAAMAAARFGNIAGIKFSYREPIGGSSSLDSWAQAHSRKAPTARKQRAQLSRDLRQPAIVVDFG